MIAVGLARGSRAYAHGMHESVSATGVAVECMTLWLERDHEARLNAARHIGGLVNDPDGPGAVRIIIGLLDLNMGMLAELMTEREVPPDDMLQAARDCLRDFSPRLPG